MVDPAGLDHLLQRARRREPEALAGLVESYGPRVFGLLLRLTGDRDVAEELTQETFLRVVRTIGRYEHVGKFEAWLFRIAANLARDRLRVLGRRGEIGSLEPDRDAQASMPAAAARGAGDPRDVLAQREAGEQLVVALGQLSPAEQEVILLRHYSRLSFREIADLLGVPLGTALARAHRGLQHLRRLMGAADET